MVEEAVEDIITLAMGNFHTSNIYKVALFVCLSICLIITQITGLG